MIYDLTADQLEAELQLIEAVLQDRGDASHANAVKAARKVKDEVLARMLVDESSPQWIRGEIENIRLALSCGLTLEANREFRYLRGRLDFISQRVREPYIASGAKGMRQRSDAGGKDKQRKWAVILADYLHSKGYNKHSAQAALSDDYGLTIETTERDFRYYIENDVLSCYDANNTNAKIGELACSTFFDKGRYFRTK